MPGPGSENPHSAPVRSRSVRERAARTLKSPARITTSSGAAFDTANHAARSTSASASRSSAGKLVQCMFATNSVRPPGSCTRTAWTTRRSFAHPSRATGPR
jgi:hypothetical protein